MHINYNGLSHEHDFYKTLRQSNRKETAAAGEMGEKEAE